MHKKNIYIASLLLLALLFSACSQSLLSRHDIISSNDLAHRESEREQEEGNGNDTVTPETPAPEFINVASAFKYILPGGIVDESCPTDLKLKLEELISSAAKKDVEYYNKNTYRIRVVKEGNLTESYFAAEDLWTLGDASKGEYTYVKTGSQFVINAAVVTNAVDVTYNQYRSINPFFSAYGAYNSRSFTSVDGSQESLMKRFHFYRWSGTVSGQGVSNYMIALDTYTGLLFQFSEIDDWATILDIDAPSKYAPFEKYEGRRNFYEYDPVGYVDETGAIITNDWYKKDVARSFEEAENTAPPLGRLSPYYFEEEVTDSIQATIPIQGGYPVSGALTVKAKSIKNTNIDALTTLIPNDTAIVGGGTITLNPPKYSYEIASCAYSGTIEEVDKSITTYKTASGQEIKKSSTASLESISKTYTFTNIEEMLSLELLAELTRDSQGVGDIKLLNGGNIGWATGLIGGIWSDVILPAASVSSKDIPTTLIFNREKQQWEDGNGFTLTAGETKDYTIQYTYGDGTVQLTYTLNWERDISSSDTGNIILQTITQNTLDADEQLKVSYSGNTAEAVYTDTTEISTQEKKEIVLDLMLYNLDATIEPIIISYINPANNLIKSVSIDDAFITKRGGSFGKSCIPVKITLGDELWKEHTITFKLVYPREGYDAEFSPKEIKLTVKREYKKET